MREETMQTWVDFTTIKQSVGLAPVLRRYQVSLRRSGRDQYRGICPIHRGEGRDAFHANLRRNVFHCFSCGAGGTVLDFVAAMEGCTVREAARKLADETGVAGGAALATCRPKATVTRKSKSVSPLGFVLHGIDSSYPYLAARGIESATAQEFGIGFYRGSGILSGRLVIPIHNAGGELVAYCGRALDGAEPRYRFPSGFAKSEVLFNLHRAAAAGQDRVVVVEGFFDCFKMHQTGVAAVALMGTALSATQQRVLLESFRSVILMLDGDEAGRHATATIAARLRPYASLRLISLPDSVQPDQLSAGEIGRILRTDAGLETSGRLC
jgi:DNA primase